jgi:thymidylate synthase (FAD)
MTDESSPQGFELRDDIAVELVRHDASDASVVEAARVSTMGERAAEMNQCRDIRTGLTARETGLINFLMRDRHGTPFEHNSMTFRVSAPIFVFREWHRHRAGWSYNEESGRYRELQPTFYVPSQERPLVQQGKPGAYTFLPGPKTLHGQVHKEMAEAYHRAYTHYTSMLSKGVAREVARMVLPVGIFSTMYATCNARSLMHFLSLRTKDAKAKVPSFPQYEIELAARKMEALWAALMPVTYDAFNEHGRVAP